MGHGASCTRVETFDESVQMPSISPTIRSSSSSSSPFPSKLIPPKPLPVRKTPIPAVGEVDEFEVKTNSDKYSSIWDFNTKVSRRSFGKGGIRRSSLSSVVFGLSKDVEGRIRQDRTSSEGNDRDELGEEEQQ